MDAFTRRGLAAATLVAGGAGLMAGQKNRPDKLRGQVERGSEGGEKVDLPPLHNSSDLEGEPPAPEPAAKRLGVAVVGLGHLSLEQILPGFGQAKHVRVTALVSGKLDKAKVVASQYGVPERNVYDYRSFDALRNNSEVDIVYVVLPNAMHAEYTVRAAQADKHVLCEKPMATSVADAQRMVEACRAAQKKLMIAYRMQYHPGHRTLIEMARTKQFGAVRYINAVNGQNDAPNGQWRQIRAMAGGGSLPDVGLYCLNAFRYLTGEEPIEITGQITQPKDDPRFREIEDVCTFSFRFPSGVFASGSSGYSFHETRHLRIMAADGWFGMDPAFSYSNLVLQIGRRSGKTNALEQHQFQPQNHFALEMDDFAQRIRKDQEPLTPGEEGLQDQKIMEAIYKSAAEGGSVVKMPQVSKLDSTRGPAPQQQT